MPDYTFALNSAAQLYCSENLKETEESRNAAFEALEKWTEENPNLHVKSDNCSLLPFLRSCKFDIERTKRKLHDYYTMRRDIPQWYQNRDPTLPEIEELVRLGVFIPLKQHLNNQLVVIIRTAVHNPKIHNQDNVFKAGNMILDIATKSNELAQIYGIIAIFDMSGVGLAHARVLSKEVIKKVVRSWQNYYCRPKQLEFINAPMYINVVLNIFKSFMKKKMKDRVRVHFDGLEGLWKVIPKDVLPKEYGGDGERLEDIIEYWRVKLLEHQAWFEEDQKHKAD